MINFFTDRNLKSIAQVRIQIKKPPQIGAEKLQVTVINWKEDAKRCSKQIDNGFEDFIMDGNELALRYSPNGGVVVSLGTTVDTISCGDRFLGDAKVITVQWIDMMDRDDVNDGAENFLIVNYRLRVRLETSKSR